MITDLKHVPTNPGVYQFFNDREIIYIGKAKNLKKRVRSYFTQAIKDRKTEQIKQQAIRVETFTTHSETEALILEQQLIKEYKQCIRTIIILIHCLFASFELNRRKWVLALKKYEWISFVVS